MTKMKCDALEEENDFRARRPSAEKGIQDSFELESKIEDLKWQLTSADIERIESANEKERLTRALADHRQNLESAQLQISQLEESNRKHQADFLQKTQEQVRQTEKERDNLKDLNTKLSTEKLRLQEQLNERRVKHDEQLQRIEQEKRKT